MQSSSLINHDCKYIDSNFYLLVYANVPSLTQNTSTNII